MGLGLYSTARSWACSLRHALGAREHLCLVLWGQRLSQFDQGADRQPARRELIGNRREPLDEPGYFGSPERRGLGKPELANAVIEQRCISKLPIELPFGKPSQLDDEFDDEVPLPPNQIGETTVDIARRGRFHSNPLTRVFKPSCAGRKAPWARDSDRAAFRRPAGASLDRLLSDGLGVRALLWAQNQLSAISTDAAGIFFFFGAPLCIAALSTIGALLTKMALGEPQR
jgi:hypothetical protein